MASHDDQSTSKSSAAPIRTKPDMTAAILLLTRQAVLCGVNSICRDETIHHLANDGSDLLFTRLPGVAWGRISELRAENRRELPLAENQLIRNICNSNPVDSLRTSCVTGNPRGSLAFDIGLSSRYRGRRWRHVHTRRASRAG